MSPTPSGVQLLFQEDLNFLLTNRLPRRLATQFAGWFSRIESPLLTRVSIAVWAFFAGDLRLDEAAETNFRSLHACFTRQLRAGVRTIADGEGTLVSPCDAEVGRVGRVEESTLLQAKGLTYTLHDLLKDDALADRHRNGVFITLRLKSCMYHRFHAPCDAWLRRVRFISGDTWNVNPIAVRRVERLFCRNERVVLELDSDDPRLTLTLVPVAAILVASIRIHCTPFPFNQRYRGADVVDCFTQVQRGEELGYFENGSTIIVLAAGGFEPVVQEGTTIQMGQPLLRSTTAATTGASSITQLRLPS